MIPDINRSLIFSCDLPVLSALNCLRILLMGHQALNELIHIDALNMPGRKCHVTVL